MPINKGKQEVKARSEPKRSKKQLEIKRAVSIALPKSKYSRDEAREWAKSNGFVTRSYSATEDNHVFGQGPKPSKKELPDLRPVKPKSKTAHWKALVVVQSAKK